MLVFGYEISERESSYYNFYIVFWVCPNPIIVFLIERTLLALGPFLEDPGRSRHIKGSSTRKKVNL